MNNAARRIQASSAVRYGGTLFRKNFDNFQIPQPKGDIIAKLKQ